jgi:hypothetical protein
VVAFRTALAARVLLSAIFFGSLASAQVPAEPTPAPAGESRPEDEVAACVKAAEEAQSQRSSHKLLAARTRFLACAQTTCPAVVRNDCAVWLSDVERLIPTVVVSAKDPTGAELIDVRVLVDGELLTNRLDGLAQPVDPGIRLFRFEREGIAPVEREVVIREGERGRRLSIVLAAPEVGPVRPEKPKPEPRPAPYPPVATYVFGGIGVAALGSFAYFGIKGTANADELGETCGKDKTCTEEQISPVRTQLLVADVSLGISLVAIGAAVYTLIVNAPSKKPQGVQTELLLAPGVGRVSLSAPF